MSRSEPEEVNVSPVVRWLQWEASEDKGHFSYYDKEIKERVTVNAPLGFLLLDRLATVTGYNKAEKFSIYANELHTGNLRQSPFVVKAHGTNSTIAEGVWRDIKEKVKSLGGQFAFSLYVMIDIDGKKCLGNVCLKGSALSAYIEFTKANKEYEGVIVWRGGTVAGESGSVKYLSPVFELQDITDETANLAAAMDRDELQPYLRRRAGISEDQVESPNVASAEETQAVMDEVDDIPF